ncbi:PAS domain S-box protein [Solimicrobium silvestre]|uniref:Sensory/regulatory protein RpfC n=1 Tax=Solimicrobium silvestre TaxID=2099400 RepID=A0A2S9H4R0_9BURK|nr:PAS domain S-box protein [Solimicrobium silvestre]PRC94931.1 PAS domain S-box protein [Solimicrobium silvestre]
MKNSLRELGRPIVICTLLIFIALISTTLFIVGQVERERTINAMKSRMLASSEIRKARLTEHINQLRHDVQFLSKVPPVQGMIRSIGHGGVDIQENTPLSLWQKRLQTIFLEFIKANPELTKLRFIGVANDGMELVRIERKQGKIFVVTQDQLQAKGDRYFFISASKLKLNQSYLSDIDLNRERGKIDEPVVRTLRAATPVFAENGEIFGIVILNRNVQSDFAELESSSTANFKIYLTNSSGDYLVNPDQQHTFGFDYGNQWRWQNDFHFDSSDQQHPSGPQSFLTSDGSTTHVVQTQIPLDENDPNRFLTLAVTLPDKTIAQAVMNAQLNSLFVILGASLLASGAMYFYWWQKRHLDKKQSEMAAIVESSHDAIIGKTLEGVVTSWNTGAEEMFGYSSKEAVHKRLVDLIVPDDRRGEEVLILRKLSNGERITDFDSIRHRKDGTLLDVSVTVSPIRSLSGKVIGAAKTVRDISQKKKDEESIRELNRTLEIQVVERTAKIRSYSALQHAILNNASYAMIATDTNGLITVFNPSAERMLGYTADEIVGKKNPEIFHDMAEVIERANAFSEELGEEIKPGFNVFVAKSIRGLPNEHEWTYVRKDGSRLSVQLSATALRDDNGNIIGYLGIVSDLTERQIAENALQAQYRFLNTLADNIPGLVAYWDRDLCCRFSNRVYYEWFGKTSEEMRGIHLRTLLGETLYAKNEHHINAAFAGQVQLFERTMTKPDGSLLYTWAHYIPDIDNGAVRGLIVLVSDVTELKVAQLNLEELNSRLKIRTNDLERTGQIAGAGAWSVDLIGKKINWSRQTALIHEVPDGYEPTVEKSIQFYTKESQHVIQSILDKALKTHQPWDIELPIITAKGKHRWTRSVGEVELNKNGDPIKLFGAIQDITERRTASEALTAVRDQLLMAAKVAGLGIWGWQLSDDSLLWNDLMFELYDQPKSLNRNGLNYEHWRSRVHQEDVEATVKCLNDAVEGHGIYDPIFRVVHLDGEVRYLKAAAYIERDDSGKALRVTGINMDITDQLLLESSLRQAKDSADIANRAKSEFLANMSHEIRTPMNAILGMLQLLQQTELDRRQVDYVSKTESAAKALLGILNDILDFSKVEAGKMELDPHPFSIDKLLRDVAVILSANVGNKDVEVLFEVDPTIPKWIISDDLRLQQILINLAGNAIKFTEHGEIVLSVKLVTSDESGLTIDFSVRDTGIGISPEQCERIFEGFSQAEASTARRFGGSGLGLAICQRLVRLMGGTLEVNSTVNVGSTFHFTMCCKRSEQVDVPSEKRLVVDTKTLHCLVVEDNSSARQILAEMLRSFRWEVDTADSGLTAIDMVEKRNKKNPYDVIFVDWRMPGMDGWETSKHIREKLSGLSATIIVMVTAHSRELIAQRKTQMPSLLDGFLVKPVTASMLYDAVADSRANNGQVVPVELRQPIQQQRLAGVRILVVEDNATNQQVARELLSNDGALVVVVDDGQAGIDALRFAEPRFDVVLMDVQMPNMDGYTATKIIRTELGETTLPIIAITANAMSSDRDAAFAAGMTDHVGKPFDLSQLISVILKHIKHDATMLILPNEELEEHESLYLQDFNADSALIRLGGNSKTYQAALKGFIREVSDSKLHYEALKKNQRRDDIRRMFHTIKGLAATVGANRLSAIAESEENYLNDPSNTGPLKELDSFWLVADSALENAKRHLIAAVDVEVTTSVYDQVDLLTLREELGRLQVQLQSSDFDAEQKYDQLHRSCGAIFPVEYKKIGECIELLKFADAALICAELLNEIDSLIS